MPSLAFVLGLAIASTAVVWIGSTRLERASVRLGSYHGLPPLVQGAVIAAIGSSFPELSSVVLATLLHGAFDLGVGAVVGSAIFNILVIPALATLASEGGLGADRDVVYKEALFYMLSISVLLLVFTLSVIYVPAAGDGLAGSVTRPLALVPIGLYGLYIFIQWADTTEYEAPEADDDIDPLKEWAWLAVSLVLIVVSVEGLVRAALELGAILGTPSYIWGLTVVAAATSLPDAVVSIQAAREHRAATSLGNVLGSNTFDLLVAVPVGVLIAGATVVDLSAAVPMMAVLTLATILLFFFLRTKMVLARWEAVGLLVLYGGFLWFVVEVGGLVDAVPGL